MLLNILVTIVGIYCLLESISAASDMHKGDRLCRLGKYLLAGASGLYLILKGFSGHATWGMLLLSAAIALGIWPRMVYRVMGGRRNTDHLRGGA